eukprot:5272509-Prymnesium_polylepis.2
MKDEARFQAASVRTTATSCCCCCLRIPLLEHLPHDFVVLEVLGVHEPRPGRTLRREENHVPQRRARAADQCDRGVVVVVVRVLDRRKYRARNSQGAPDGTVGVQHAVFAHDDDVCARLKRLVDLPGAQRKVLQRAAPNADVEARNPIPAGDVPRLPPLRVG